MHVTDKWLSVTEATEVLGLSASGIRGLIREGRIKAVQLTEGGKYRIRESECNRFLAEIENNASRYAAYEAPA